MNNFNEILTCLFLYNKQMNEIPFPFEESFIIREESNDIAHERVEEYLNATQSAKHNARTKLQELGVENPDAIMEHFELLYDATK